jgi:hypothetical protein
MTLSNPKSATSIVVHRVICATFSAGVHICICISTRCSKKRRIYTNVIWGPIGATIHHYNISNFFMWLMMFVLSLIIMIIFPGPR